jgi:hypothetical protein
LTDRQKTIDFDIKSSVSTDSACDNLSSKGFREVYFDQSMWSVFGGFGRSCFRRLI